MLASLESSLSVVTVLVYWTFHAREIQARERVFHTGHLEALWFIGSRPTFEFSPPVDMVLMCWTFHAREIQAEEPVLHTSQHEALWFRGIRPTMNRTTRICRHTADTQEAIDLFDIVLEPMLTIRLQRTPCILMWRLRYFELLALLALVWASALYFPLAVSRSVPGSRSQEKWHGHKTFEGRLSEAGLCDLTPRMASPKRIGESSGSSGSSCATPGEMAQRTGRCVSQSLRVGERARAARLCDTHSVPSAKKKHSTNTTTRGYTAQAHCTLVLLPHVRTVSLIHSHRARCGTKCNTKRAVSSHTHVPQPCRFLLLAPRVRRLEAAFLLSSAPPGCRASVTPALRQATARSSSQRTISSSPPMAL